MHYRERQREIERGLTMQSIFFFFLYPTFNENLSHKKVFSTTKKKKKKKIEKNGKKLV